MNTVLIIIVVGLILAVLYLWQKTQKPDIKNEVEDKIAKVASEALKSNSEQFIILAKEILGSEKKEIKTDLEGKKSLINELIKEIREDIRKNELRVRQSDDDRIKSYSSLKQELESYQRVTGELKLSTDKLRSLLSNNQLRGAFGEQVAENLLKMSGFVIGQDYFKNTSQSEEGTRPDFTVLLPDKTKINVDAKFPYASLVKSVEAQDAEEKKKHFTNFKQDVKEKIKQVCTRHYINPEDKTVDFVILFIPNEMIFSYIYENMNEIWEEGMRKKVILAGPFSFTAILRMVRQAHTNFRYQENLQHIVGLIHKFDEEYQKYSGAVDVLGDRIISTQKQFDQVSNTRNRQLTTVVDKIKNQSLIEEKEPKKLLED